MKKPDCRRPVAFPNNSATLLVEVVLQTKVAATVIDCGVLDQEPNPADEFFCSSSSLGGGAASLGFGSLTSELRMMR